MEAQDRFLVSLDALVMEGEILVKWVPQEYMQKIVKELLKYMLDPSPDEKNPGYDQAEKRIVDLIKGWMEEKLPSGSKCSCGHKLYLSARTNNGPGPILLDLDKILDSYAESIVQQRPQLENNSSVPYVELYAAHGVY